MVTTPTFWGSQVIFSTSPLEHNAEVSARPDNSFVIVWDDEFKDLHGRRLNSTGSFTGGDFLTAMSSNVSEDLRLPVAVTRADGLTQVFFHLLASPTEEDIFVTFPSGDFSSSGSALTTFIDTAVDEFMQTAAPVEFNNQAGTAIVWRSPRGATSASDLHLGYVAANGVLIGNDIIVPVASNETVVSADVAGLGNGTGIVAFQVFNTALSKNFVRYAVYNDYDLISGPFDAAPTPGDDFFPQATQLLRSSDGFVVVSQNPGGLGFFYHAFGQEFTAAVPGTSGGGSGGFAKAINPMITALEDQGFIIAWTDTSETEGDGTPALRVALQRFNSAGQPVGDNLFINGPGDQSLDSIATLDDGRVVVTFSNETGDSTNLTTLAYQIVDPREPLIFGSNFADNITSREDGAEIQAFDGADTLIGRAGNDTLDGGTGNDTMSGGAGNDVYVANTGDVIVELFLFGLDVVQAAASFSIQAIDNVERVYLTGTAAADADGNGLDNLLLGNTAANRLRGFAGNDTLNGGAGSDTLIGGDGIDLLKGGSQRDKITLTGDTSPDTVVFASLNDSTGVTRDVVEGMDLANEDRFDLPVIPTAIAAAIVSGNLSTATFNADLAAAVTAARLPAGQAVLFDPSGGTLNQAGMVYLIIDANGVAGYQPNADYVIQLQNMTGTLTPNDFI